MMGNAGLAFDIRGGLGLYRIMFERLVEFRDDAVFL
jgi:hypothetical protein